MNTPGGAVDVDRDAVARAADDEECLPRAAGAGAGDTLAWPGLNALRPLALL